MAVLYIAGSQPGAGKTALATALASTLAQQGRSVALIKPVRVVEDSGAARGPDQDSSFYLQALPGNPGPQGWPLLVTAQQLAQDKGVLQGAQATVAAAGAGKDVIIVEGLDGLVPQNPSAQASAGLAKALGARVVILARYNYPGDAADLVGAAETFGSSLLGVILNSVPHYRARDAEMRLSPALQARGLPVLGIVPEDRRMLAPAVRDLAQHLGGEFLLLEERADELAEAVMIGGFFLDPGDYIFSRRERKAVIVRGDRPDLQMAALKTSTVCLLLTGGQNPIQYVTYHAQEEGVPIVLTQHSTLDAMERLHTVAQRVTVHNPRKVACFQELLAQHCHLKPLYAGLGLS